MNDSTVTEVYMQSLQAQGPRPCYMKIYDSYIGTCGASAWHLQQNGKLTQKQRAKRIQLKSYLKQTSNLGVKILKDCYVKEKR